MYYSQKLFDQHKLLFYAWFPAMFTRIDILLSVDNVRNDLAFVAEQLETEIKRFEAIANRFDTNSELSQLNQMAFENEFETSPELFQIVSECLAYNQSTLGFFDIAVNSENNLKSGIEHLILDKENQTIRFAHPDVKLDLSGFIKGYVLRPVKQILDSAKIENALINMGNSSILAIGNHPHGSGWKINYSNEHLKDACVLQNQCLTTSGNNKHTRWPIRMPLTGKMVMQNKPVSVITDDPAIGEVLSTALYIANKKEKVHILSQLHGTVRDYRN